MIYYLVTQAHAYTMSSFLAFRGKHLSSRIKILPYENLFRKKYLHGGAYIFSDLERLGPEIVRQAAKVRHALDESSLCVSILNHPGSSLTRYALLRKLYDTGINPFNVYRADEARIPERFPVFLRRENDHEGSITPLLQDKIELSKALDAVKTSGTRLSDILIVEYCDTRNDADVFVKYSVFKLGDHIFARHRFTSHDWIVKDPEQSFGDTASELAFLKQNPHAQALSHIFHIAGIDYGRLDYSLFNDHPVIWEINTNPMIASVDIFNREKIENYIVKKLTKAVVSLDSLAHSDGRIVNPVYAGWAKRGQAFIKHIVKQSPIPVQQKLQLRDYYKRFTETK